MTHPSHPIRRAARAAAAALTLGAALPALAQQAQEPQQAQEQAVQSTDAMTVVRDAETGKLRAATAAEQQKLAASRARMTIRAVAPSPLPKTHATGARGARLTDAFLSSSVAVRQPDGKLKIEHGTAETARSDAHAPLTPVTE